MMMMFTVNLPILSCVKKEVSFASDGVHYSVILTMVTITYLRFSHLCMLIKTESIYNVWMISREEDGF